MVKDTERHLHFEDRKGHRFEKERRIIAEVQRKPGNALGVQWMVDGL